MGDVGHVIGNICLVCLASFLFLIFSVFLLPAGLLGLIMAALIVGLIGAGAARTWWEGLIDGFFVGLPYLMIFGGSLYFIKTIVDEFGGGNSLASYMSNLLTYGIAYVILIYLVIPAGVGAMVGYVKSMGETKTQQPARYYQNAQYSPHEVAHVKSRIMSMYEERDRLEHEKKERMYNEETLKEMLLNIPQNEENQWKIDQINKKLETNKMYLDNVLFQLEEINTMLKKIENEYSAPLCDKDGFPLRFVKVGGSFRWFCDLCGTYAEGWRDWSNIEDMEPAEKSEKINVLLNTYAKLDKLYKKGKITPQKYKDLKSILKIEINKLREKPSVPKSEDKPAKVSKKFMVLPDKVMIKCPNCGFSDYVTPDMLGKKLVCPNCGTEFLAEMSSEDSNEQ